MEDIVSRLINIESKARELTQAADEEINRLPRKIEERKKEIDEEIVRDTEIKLKKIEETAIKDANVKVAQIYEESKVKFAQVEELFAQIHEKLENDIFEKIIGR